MSTKAPKYTLKNFLEDFLTTTQCLEAIKRRRWPNGIPCKTCERITRHHLIISRRTYSCQYCGRQVSPTSFTIFHGSKQPLPDWFYVIYTMASTRTGVAAKQIQREVGCSYPTALRMCNLIRTCLEEDHHLSGTVEMDEVYLGNSRRYFGRKRKRGRGVGKRPVFGAVERGGAVVAKVVPNCQRKTLYPIIKEHVAKGSTVYTDEYVVYKGLEKMDPKLSWTYRHETVNHSAKEYVKYLPNGEKVHTNEIEGFWSYPKNAIKGVHRGVSDRHLQGYVSEYAFRQSHRNDDQHMFFSLLDRIVQAESYAQAA